MTAPIFERQATGGAIARTGFEYQDAFVLEQLPAWLAESAFSHVVSELLGDVEVRYFRPGGGTVCTMYEAKNHALSKRDLWAEIENFQSKHRYAPDEYVRFALVCEDYLEGLRPVLNKLRRLRGVGASLNVDSTVRGSGEADILAALAELGASEATANFILERVEFIEYSSGRAREAFVGILSTHLPELACLRTNEVRELESGFEALVAESSKRPVNRAELERLIEQALSIADVERWRSSVTSVQLTQYAIDLQQEQLGIAIGDFSGPQRGALDPRTWTALQNNAFQLGDFIKMSRQRATIKLDGKQRMSLACVLGFCFSAARGFRLQVNHNGVVYRTDEYDRAPDEFFDTTLVNGAARADEGIVGIGFPTNAAHDITKATNLLGLANVPKLFLQSNKVVADMQALNAAVMEAKAAVSNFRGNCELKQLHLFIKAPSVFAMILGHRLNGLGAIQLYDWVDDAYVPTARLE